MSTTLPNAQNKCFHVFYSKDLHKKKKVYKQGILLQTANNVKLFDQDGQLVTSFKNKQTIEVDQQYTANNTYVITIDKVGNIDDYNTGAIFTKKQMMVLPIKKKAVQGLNATTKTKLEDLVQLKCGLAIQKHIYQILRPHQIQGVQFMYSCVSGKKNPALHGCILADFMGLGKTLQTLALTYSMIRSKQIKKFVIVCPLTLLDVWQKQSKKWLQQRIAPLVCFGDGSETTNIVKNFANYDYRMLIISYETFYKNIQKLSGKCDLIIFDEGHRMKNKKSKLLLKLKTFRCEQRILLTGTPIQNNLQELYTCISIINPRMFGSQTIFKNVFQKPILEGLAKKATKAQKQLAKQRTVQLSRQLKQFSLRRTADVLKKFLPPKNEHLVFLSLTSLQKLWYQRIVQGTKQDKQDKDDMFKTLNYLRKLFVHPNVLKMAKLSRGDFQHCSEDCSQELSYKIEFTLKIIKQCVKNCEKCVVVSYYTETLDFIAKILKQLGITYAKLDGRLKGQQRKLAVAKFEGQSSVLLLSGKAGGTGLTLICASKMIMIQPDWNPSNDSQVMGRVWRQGQTKQVHIYRLVIASSFQQKMLQRQGLKKTLANNLIDNGDSKQQSSDGIDFDNLGKLFVDNKGQVLTYKHNENQIQQFMENHPYLHKQHSSLKNNEFGVLFVKTNKSTNQQDIIANKSIKKKEFQTDNQFSNISLCHFAQKQQKNEKNGQEQDNDEQFDDDEGQNQESEQQISRIQKVQKIKYKMPAKLIVNKDSMKELEINDSCLNNPQKYKQDQQQSMNKQNTQNDIQTTKFKQVNIKVNDNDDQTWYPQCAQEDAKKSANKNDVTKIIMTKLNGKNEVSTLGPASNLLKKIIKK